ncbi:nucleotidyltransferase domain-containing protein [Actinoallomurus sp. CA-150999]|uniref:nucleotidyltransferase domain-containing protein n=1 Tax=Actinoallomurus sp. CA-150999 TaxID=3239887 RepID=UPI003D8EF17F
MRSIVAPYGRWEPATPAQVASLLSALPCRWWVAGGYAIELAAGRRLRDHGDIDVMLLRPDQIHLHGVLRGWEHWAADPPGVLRPWEPAETLPQAVHDVWCRPGPDEPWRIQIMLDETRDGDWLSRRDPGIRRPLPEIGEISPEGVPYLAPEIQLFYKAKQPRPKDETDFAAVLPFLTQVQRRWLNEALAHSFGTHPWRDQLAC